MESGMVSKADNLRAVGSGIIKLADMCPVRLPAGCELRIVSAAQATLLDFLAENPFCHIVDIEISNGDPLLLGLKLNEVVTRKIRFPRAEQQR